MQVLRIILIILTTVILIMAVKCLIEEREQADILAIALFLLYLFYLIFS